MSHYLYIIEHDLEKTYCGVTNDPIRRINQHNGIIKGGAKSTRGKEWEYFCIITGFENRTDLLRMEWRFHHPDGKRKKSSKYYGIEGRILTIKDVLLWWRGIENKKNEMKIYIKSDYKEFLGEIELCEMKDLDKFWKEYGNVE